MDDFPSQLDLNNVEDAVVLLEWLAAQPKIETNPLELPGAAYGFNRDEATMRAMGGMLAIQQKRNLHHQAAALIRKVLTKSTLSDDKLRALLAELERHEAEQRRLSVERLHALTVPDAQETPDDESGGLVYPYIGIQVTEEGDYGTIFAVEMRGVHPTRNPIPTAAATAELMLGLHHATDYWQDRCGLGVEVRLGWRFMTHKQRLSIALMVRVNGAESEEQAREMTRGLWQTIDSLLPLNRTVYDYAPVTDKKQLEWLRMPGEIASAFAISRQQYAFKFDGKSLYMVYQVAAGNGDRLSLLAEMLRQPGVSILDIQIKATRWHPDERAKILDMFKSNENDNPFDFQDPIDTLIKRFNDTRYMSMLESYNASVGRLRMVEVYVTVASTDAQSALPVVTALNLFGTSHYEIHPAVLEEDREIAVRHLRDMNQRGWVRSQAPKGLERLIHLWTPDEALAAFQLPMAGAAGLPGMAVTKTKRTAVPADLPDEGLLVGDAHDPTLNRSVPVQISYADRARHIYLVGRTGTGKTTLLENMALQDIRAGQSVGIIDPHGDLIDAILERMPPERAKDVVLFDPSNNERPVGLNILDVEGDFEKNMMISEFMGLMYSIYDPGRTGIIGPRFEQAVRNAMHTALAIKGSTLIDVMRILSNRSYAKKCLQFVTDPMVRAYWEDIVEGQSDFHRSETLDYITSKFGRFTGDTAIRNIIGQSETTLNFNTIMDEGKILLVNLSKGKIGQENSRFLGLLLVPRLLIAAFSRARRPAKQRRPFYLYVDEFHNFTTPMFSTMLSEGRKYGLSLTLANQFISQLHDDVRESIFGNVGTLGVFQVGVKDAHLLEQEMYPVFNTDDLVNLPPFHMAFKMASGQPFMLKTRASQPQVSAEMADAIREYSMLHYGRDSVVVNAEIRQRFEKEPKGRG